MDDFDNLMITESLRLLEDSEVRVRLAVGQLLRALATKRGVAVIQACQATVLESIHTHFVSEQLRQCSMHHSSSSSTSSCSS